MGHIPLSPRTLYTQPPFYQLLGHVSTSEIGFVEILTAPNKARTAKMSNFVQVSATLNYITYYKTTC